MLNELKTNIKNLTLIVPIINEKVNVSLFVYMVNILYSGIEIIFIYEDDNDNSLNELNVLKRKFDVKFYKAKSKGIAGSIKTGLEFIKINNIVGVALADDLGLIYILDRINVLFENEKNLVVSTTRYSKGGKRLHGSKIEHLFSLLANTLFFRFVFGLTDATTAFRFAYKDDFEKICKDIDEKSWSFNLYFISNAKKMNYKIKELPVISIDRIKFGKSTFNLFPWIKKYLITIYKSLKN